MKVEIDENGLMTVTPETPVEVFAIKQWTSKNWINQKDNKRCEQGHFRGSSIIVIESIQ